MDKQGSILFQVLLGKGTLRIPQTLGHPMELRAGYPTLLVFSLILTILVPDLWVSLWGSLKVGRYRKQSVCLWGQPNLAPNLQEVLLLILTVTTCNSSLRVLTPFWCGGGGLYLPRLILTLKLIFHVFTKNHPRIWWLPGTVSHSKWYFCYIPPDSTYRLKVF